MSTAAERFYASVTDPGLKGQIQDNALQAFRAESQGYLRKNPFSQSQAAAVYLETQGVGTMPYSCRLHTHGADKALENQMLEMTSYRLNRLHPGPYTFLQLKPGKLGQFRVPFTTRDGQWRERGRARTDGDQFINWAKEVRDFSRFDGGLYTPIENLQDQRILHPVAYMSDTLHFLQPEDLVWLFLANPELTDLLATVVLPIEVNEQMRSLHPEIYKLEYFPASQGEGSFAYYPGGHAGSGYVHKTSTMQWLQIGRIECGPLSLTVDKVETLAAHHLLHITRRRADMPCRFLFETSEYSRVPEIFHPVGYNAQQAYPSKLLYQMEYYVRSVKTVTLRDISAKIRSIIPTSELPQLDMRDITCLENYFFYKAKLSHLCDAETLVDQGWIGGLLVRFRAKFRPILEKLFGKSDYAQLLELCELKRVSFTTIPKVVRFRHSNFSLNLSGGRKLPGPGEFPPRAPADWGFDNDRSDCNSTASSDSSAPSSTGPESPSGGGPAGGSESPGSDGGSDKGNGGDIRNTRGGRPPLPPLNMDELKKEIWKGELPAREEVLSAMGERYDAEERKILLECGFTDLAVQRGPMPSRIAEKNGIAQNSVVEGLKLWDIPCIFKNRTCPQAVDWPEETPAALVSALESVGRLPRQYTVDRDRGSAFSSSCKHRQIGLLMKKQTDDVLRSIDSRTEFTKMKLPVVVIHGAGGSGKSRALQNAIRSDALSKHNYTIVVPTQELRQDWIAKLPMMKRNVATFERAMLEGAKPIVFFDDYGKLPAGYIDCWLATHTSTKLAVLTADARQSVYHCDNSQAAIHGLTDNVSAFDNYSSYYLNCTHRNPRNVANALFVHASRADFGAVSEGPAINAGLTVLVPSRASKDALNEMGHDSYTFAGCQGLTKPGINVVLDHSAPFCSDQVMYTALSRTTSDIHFVNAWGEGEGAETKRNCTPYINAIITHRREQEVDENLEQPAPVTMAEEHRIKTHCAVVNPDALVENLASTIADKYEREMWDAERGAYTNVFQTEDPIVQAMAHQQARDEVLFQATIDARLQISSSQANEAEVAATTKLGDLLFEAYYKRMGLTGTSMPFESDLWAECEAEVERTYLSKPQSALENGEDRQSPDMEPNSIALFLKSQWVKKEEKLGKPAKAGQTIAAFRQDVVMKFGVAARYMRRMRERTQPKNLFIMCEKTPEDMSSFVRENWNFNRDNYESDYTQYDQSQDGCFLNFELRKMRYYELPDDCVLAYKWIKCHARVFCGELSIMRLSGEGPTFDANTECGIAYDSLKFDIPEDVTALYAGDDLARDKVCPERKCWSILGPQFKLIAKPVITRRPQFCGWRLTKYGVIKSPLKLWAGLQLADRRGQMEDVARSYGIDYKYAFDLGDKIYEVFDEEDMEYHTASTRMLVRHGYGISTGDHTPAYHVRSDSKLSTGLRSETKAAIMGDELSEADNAILRIMNEETAGSLTSPRSN